MAMGDFEVFTTSFERSEVHWFDGFATRLGTAARTRTKYSEAAVSAWIVHGWESEHSVGHFRHCVGREIATIAHSKEKEDTNRKELRFISRGN